MHILNKYFNNIFLISHPESTRHKQFLNSWSELKFTQATFVHQKIDCIAFNGMACHKFNEFEANIALKDPLSDGQVACALAHMLIYKNIIELNLNNTLILEDDSVFNNISNLEIGLQSDYDILSLFTAACDLYIPATAAAPLVSNYTRAGTSAYVIRTPEIAKRLLKDQCESMNTADGVIMRSDMKVYAVWPPVCSCNDSPSIIVGGLY